MSHVILMVPAVVVVVVLRALRPWILVRFSSLEAPSVGPLACVTELYLCERDAGINVPSQRYLDIVHVSGHRVCNQQLLQMWKRRIGVWPRWLMQPVFEATHHVRGGTIHRADTSQGDRDVHNLLDRYPAHLQFTAEEHAWGQAQLRSMGIPLHAPFVCLIVRDDAYGNSRTLDRWTQTYRNCDIQNFVLASEELADRGYWVIRMGAEVREAIRSRHPRVIDYATNGLRTDFMDVYLGATCTFCLSTGLGFDFIPLIFRRPVAYVNHAPLGLFVTFSERSLSLTKRHYSVRENRELTLREIVTSGVVLAGETQCFGACGVRLVECTPEEVRDLAVEMSERLNGTWLPHPEDASLQARFWALFPHDIRDPENGRPLHGAIRSRYSAAFLRQNPDWLK